MRIYLILVAISLTLCKFPKKFEFGASTSAFQIEGGWLQEGKTLSVWDNLAHSGVAADKTNADVADNSYNMYKEDIAVMKEYGIKNYRMSIAWSRILPMGFKDTKVNEKAINHYKNQFQELIKAGITPFVTLYHNDMPINLMMKGEGYTDPDFVDDFVYYAEICYKNFGDLVKYWFTFNEPWCLAILDEFEPEELPTKSYNIAHSLLRAHAKAVKVYRDKYQAQQKGKIGWVVNTEMYFPKDKTKELDRKAAERGLIFQLDWFSEPLFTGDYPKMMKEIVKNRLPSFTDEEKKMLKGSLDFYALNHYFTVLAESDVLNPGNYYGDRNIKTSYDPVRKRTDMGWPVVPDGFYELIMYIHKKWLINTNIELYITENGAAVNEATIKQALNDNLRIEYLQSYLDAVEKAIGNGVNLTKYFIWSLLDNFEWGSGLSKRFGVVRVEYNKKQQRIAKGSLRWFSELLKGIY